MMGRVLSIAGSDSGGGAGIQADIKTISALGGFAMTAITALTAQNTCGVDAVYPVPPAFVIQQIDAVWSDIGVDCVKIGMLANAELVEAVAGRLKGCGVPVVLDPVMLSTSGAALLSPEGIHALTDTLLPQADLVTPNLPEAELLTKMPIRSVEDMRRAAMSILSRGPKAVLLKGGHLTGETLTDLLVSAHGESVWSGQRTMTRNTHGTGCTLASAIATGLAQGPGMEAAIDRAHLYLRAAIRRAPGLGTGAGPVDHTVTIDDRWRA